MPKKVKKKSQLITNLTCTVQTFNDLSKLDN